MKKLLSLIENYGNKIPHPSLMFGFLALLIVLISSVAEFFTLAAVNPISHEVISAKGLISADGLRYMLTTMVSNFTQFAPLGIVLVAMLGIGIAEKSGLLSQFLSKLVRYNRSYGLTYGVAFCGIISSLGADSGYVVLIPLAGLLFKAAGRSPIAGIATAFAGVSGGYSANLLIGPIDALLAGISTEAIHILHPTQSVSVSANWYFNIVSTFFIAAIITAVTHLRAWPAVDVNAENSTIEVDESASFKGLGIFSVVFFAVLAACLVPENGILRDPISHSLAASPFINSLVIIIALYFAGSGIIFGFANKRFDSASSVIVAMEETMASMAGYLVMMFFAAQFIAYFNWSNLGLIIAINGANGLAQLALNKALLLVLFIFISALINLFIGSSSAKWALMAPIFIPMLALLGVSPEAAQLAYRIGDSSTNIITPMMPYFALVLAFTQQHDKNAGLGTLMAAMLPYSLALLVAWPLLFLLWIGLDLPLGF